MSRISHGVRALLVAGGCILVHLLVAIVSYLTAAVVLMAAQTKTGVSGCGSLGVAFLVCMPIALFGGGIVSGLVSAK